MARRSVRLLVAALACCSTLATAACSPTTAGTTDGPTSRDLSARVSEDLLALEERFDARVGVHAVDTGSGDQVSHRADERFAYASTIKTLLLGAFLEDRPSTVLDEEVRVAAENVRDAGYTPVTADRVGTTMTVRELGAAAISESDNGASNVFFELIGGPEGLQEALIAIGDTTTEIDAVEPGLNDFTPGETPRTSTPLVMAEGLAAYALGDRLEPEVRDAYTTWLRQTMTGDDTIRAGSPPTWVVGGKTGSAGRYAARNDVAIVWPPGGDPIVLSVMTDRSGFEDEYDDELLAATADVVLGQMTRSAP